MIIGIMQPYFWPYLGYFQLICAVDQFVIYDNIEYTKKGWINRNRYLCNGKDKYFTIPLKRDSDFLDIERRYVSDDFDREKLKKQIEMAYKKSPNFQSIFPLFCDCIEYRGENLFDFIYYSIKKINSFLDINTDIIVSSTLGIGHEVKGKDKVLAICKKLGATEYINAIGGQTLYDKQEFKQNDISLSFIQMNPNIEYQQFDNQFIPMLSILDVLMFNSVENVKRMLQEYTLI